MGNRLTFYIVIALVIGLLTGWAMHEAIKTSPPATAAFLKDATQVFPLVTTLFLRLIKMIIAPLVFSTLIVGIAHMGDSSALGRVGLRALTWFICASLVSLSLGWCWCICSSPAPGSACRCRRRARRVGWTRRRST